MILLAISKEPQSQHCKAARIACCRTLGVKPELLESLVQAVETIPDVKIRDMILFALKCARDPRSLTNINFGKLHQHGLTLSETVEIIAMSAFAVYANIIADATGMEPDSMFDTVEAVHSPD